ncbi:type II toxin-antitoxin system Phd/YefM family antitoxin [Persephonella sp. KM09-Lau-8]|uniref:type II toxin-antitoxin system Phd/YefM family antitoxin n=1 Tax=Persephonella sp. KM09-Lau-8 TaxID=1158345 RepID=UPI000497312B|nr:type II toxin-antitoxin system Phd/YefM family antitoxin [Persephonella sp. KM09-Lau-8]
MKVLNISQAQKNFTKILNESTLIIDNKKKEKKAVIIPYKEYLKLISQCQNKEDLLNMLSTGKFSKFRGMLDKNLKINDDRYNNIVQD